MLKNNGIFKLDKYYVIFNYIVSKIEGLTILDGEPISQDSRDDCEKYYFRHVYPAFLDCSSDSDKKCDFYLSNPTFEKLLDKFGPPAVAKKLTKEEQIRENFVSLNVYYNDKKLVKQVPRAMNVTNLKLILRRLLKIDRDIDFDLKIEGTNYSAEIMDERHDVGVYRIDDEHRLTIVPF